MYRSKKRKEWKVMPVEEEDSRTWFNIFKGEGLPYIRQKKKESKNRKKKRTRVIRQTFLKTTGQNFTTKNKTTQKAN